jgi:hypothetical protein
VIGMVTPQIGKCVLRQAALVNAARWEGLDVLTLRTRPCDGHDVTDH